MYKLLSLFALLSAVSMINSATRTLRRLSSVQQNYCIDITINKAEFNLHNRKFEFPTNSKVDYKVKRVGSNDVLDQGQIDMPERWMQYSYVTQHPELWQDLEELVKEAVNNQYRSVAFFRHLIRLDPQF